jgi:hypothetical protein
MSDRHLQRISEGHAVLGKAKDWLATVRQEQHNLAVQPRGYIDWWNRMAAAMTDEAKAEINAAFIADKNAQDEQERIARARLKDAQRDHDKALAVVEQATLDYARHVERRTKLLPTLRGILESHFHIDRYDAATVHRAADEILYRLDWTND